MSTSKKSARGALDAVGLATRSAGALGVRGPMAGLLAGTGKFKVPGAGIGTSGTFAAIARQQRMFARFGAATGIDGTMATMRKADGGAGAIAASPAPRLPTGTVSLITQLAGDKSFIDTLARGSLTAQAVGLRQAMIGSGAINSIGTVSAIAAAGTFDIPAISRARHHMGAVGLQNLAVGAAWASASSILDTKAFKALHGAPSVVDTIAGQVAKDFLNLGGPNNKVTTLLSQQRALIDNQTLRTLAANAQALNGLPLPTVDLLREAVAHIPATSGPPLRDDVLIDNPAAVTDWLSSIVDRIVHAAGWTERDLKEDAVVAYVYTLAALLMLAFLLYHPVLATVCGYLGVGGAHQTGHTVSKMTRKLYRAHISARPEDSR